MKVLILANHEMAIYNLRLELVQKLLEDVHSVYIALPFEKRIAQFQQMGCHVEDIQLDRHGKNPFQDIRLLLQYISLLRKIKPNIVFSYTIKPNIYGGLACRFRNTPIVMNITGLGTALEYPGILQTIAIMLYRVATSKVQKVFLQNTENLQFFAKNNIAHGKCALLPGSGVNLDRFSILPYPAEDIINFVFIARIMKEKGIEEYIAAARYIRAKYPNTSFHVCGFCEEKYEETLQTLCEQGVIQYHGMVDDVREILRNTHCTIHPSYSEGMANVLLESCATARPIIATNRPGCREVIDDGVNGYLVEPKDTNDLIEKIELFLRLPHDEKVSMGMAGRHKVEKEFDRNLVTEAYLEQLETPIL